MAVLKEESGSVTLVNGVGTFRYKIATPKPTKIVDVVCTAGAPANLTNLQTIPVYIPPKPPEVLTVSSNRFGIADTTGTRLGSYFKVTSNDPLSTVKAKVRIQEYDGNNIIEDTTVDVTLVAGTSSTLHWHKKKYRNVAGKIVFTLLTPNNSTDTYHLNRLFDTTNWYFNIYHNPSDRNTRVVFNTPGLPDGTKIGSNANAWMVSFKVPGDPSQGYNTYGFFSGNTPSTTQVVSGGKTTFYYDVSPEDFVARGNKGLPKPWYNKVHEWRYDFFPLDQDPGWAKVNTPRQPSTVTVPV